MNSLFIQGQWQTGHGNAFKSISPVTEEIVWEGTSAVQADVDAAVQAAKKAFLTWSQLSAEERLVYLKKYQMQIEKSTEELAYCISLEMGKPLWEARAEVKTIINKVELSDKAYHERTVQTQQTVSEHENLVIRYKPQGVLAVLGPFNFPAHLPNAHIIPALLAGNTIVLKPSELTPKSAQLLISYWQAIDLPPGVVNLIQGGRETGAILSAHPDIVGLLFTGSYQAGKFFHQQWAGQPEKLLVLEMGGNNPLVIETIHDIHAACLTIIQSAFITSGQRCTCTRRLIVIDTKQNRDMIEKLCHTMQDVKVDSPFSQTEPFMGTVVSRSTGKHLLAKQQELQKLGGKVLVPMRALQDNDAMLTPGLIDMTAIQRSDEEIFGPLLQLIYVKDLNEAIQEANNTHYGLAAGILSDDIDIYHRFLSQSHAGVINWNRATTGSHGAAPFGGVQRSGNYRPSGYFAADYCVHPVASLEQATLHNPDVLPPGILK